jgi:hypothetical protein
MCRSVSGTEIVNDVSNGNDDDDNDASFLSKHDFSDDDLIDEAVFSPKKI